MTLNVDLTSYFPLHMAPAFRFNEPSMKKKVEADWKLIPTSDVTSSCTFIKTQEYLCLSPSGFF